MFPYQLHKSFTGAAYYRHELLSSEMLIHGFFTRKGGYSTGEFLGLNSSLTFCAHKNLAALKEKL